MNILISKKMKKLVYTCKEVHLYTHYINVTITYIILLYYCSTMYIIKHIQKRAFERRSSNTFCQHSTEGSCMPSFRNDHFGSRLLRMRSPDLRGRNCLGFEGGVAVGVVLKLQLPRALPSLLHERSMRGP